MLIRSQDKKKIINLDNVLNISVTTLDGSEVIWCGGRIVAEYSTEAKAIKVLDMIEKKYMEYVCISSISTGVHSVYTIPKVFQMPADDEVEDD